MADERHAPDARERNLPEERLITGITLPGFSSRRLP
jgi:hypothetical protein